MDIESYENMVEDLQDELATLKQAVRELCDILEKETLLMSRPEIIDDPVKLQDRLDKIERLIR